MIEPRKAGLNTATTQSKARHFAPRRLPVNTDSTAWPLQHAAEACPEQLSLAQPNANGKGGVAVRFGRFSVVRGARQLLADGRHVEIGSRAFDLLIVLLS